MIHRDEPTDHIKLPEEPSIIVTFFNKDGCVCNREEESISKSVEYFHGYDDVSVHYFVRVGSGEVLDPHATHLHLNKSKLKRFEFKKVTTKAWGFYSKYLKDKKRQNFTNARRLIME